jgi:hypothetical protein
MVHLLETKSFKELTQVLMKVRLECLNVKQKSRGILLTNLSENDILGGSINLLITCKNYPVQRATLALVSVLSSSEPGKKYVIGNNAGYICTLIFNLLKKEEKNSVCSRFCIAALEKLSLNDAAAAAMVDLGLSEYLSNHLEPDLHPFLQNFSTALLFNLLSIVAGRTHISSNHELYNKILSKLVNHCKTASLDLDVIYHCLLSANRILKVYPNLLISKDFNRIVEIVRQSEEKDEETKAKIFEICGKLLNRQGRKEEKLKKGKEKNVGLEEFYYFECFTDEAPLIHGD